MKYRYARAVRDRAHRRAAVGASRRYAPDTEERSEHDWRTPQAAGTHAVEALGRKLGTAPEADRRRWCHYSSSPLRCSRDISQLGAAAGARVGGRLRIGVSTITH